MLFQLREKSRFSRIPPKKSFITLTTGCLSEANKAEQNTSATGRRNADRKNKNLSPAEIYFLHLQPFKVKSFFSSLSNKTFDVGPKICSRPSAVSLIERKNAHFVCAKNWMPKVNKMLYQSSPRCHLSRCHNFCVIKSVVFFDEGIRWH